MKRLDIKMLLRMGLPVIIVIFVIIGGSFVSRNTIRANSDSIYAKAKVIEIVEDNSGNQPYGGAQKVLAKISSGDYKGQLVELDNTNSYQRGAFCVKGTKIIALLNEGEDGSLTGSVYNYDRTGLVYIIGIIFAGSLLLIGGKKGAAALYALVFTFIVIIGMYIPMLYVGVSGIWAAVSSAFVILVISIYILNGWSNKSLYAIAGTLIGVLVSGLVSMLLGYLFKLNGYNMAETESMVYIANNSSLRVSDILYAQILISSLGAVMDVSVSIVAALTEIKEKAPAIGFKELMKSGFVVGHDMMGTMSNTLILAYAGSATGALLTMYAYEMPYLQLMGYNSIIIEILSGLCGTLGVILTVPIQTAITAFFLSGKSKS